MKNISEKDNFDEDLAIATASERNWRGILIALLVIVIVLALIVTSVILLTPPDVGPRVRGKRFEIGDLLRSQPAVAAAVGTNEPLRPHIEFNGSWISDHQLIFVDHTFSIRVLNATDLRTSTIMPSHTFSQLQPETYKISGDHKLLLIGQNRRPLTGHRYRTEAKYSIFDPETLSLRPVRLRVGRETDAGHSDRTHPFLSYAEWSPKWHANGLFVVYHGDIFYMPDYKTDRTYRLTDTAVADTVTNGLPDWLYEEEILKSDKAMWVSDSGNLLLYATFNDSGVDSLTYPVYGTGNMDYLYPQMRRLRYPKAGRRNPQVSLHVIDLVDLEHMHTVRLQEPIELRSRSSATSAATSGTSFASDFYFTNVVWLGDTEVSVTWLNRAQDLAVISICRTPTWQCITTYKISSSGGIANGPQASTGSNAGDDRRWIAAPASPRFNRDHTAYLTIAPVRIDVHGYYLHIVYVNVAKQRSMALTHGLYEVLEILAWDHDGAFVYFLAVPEKRSGQRHVYRISSSPPQLGETLSKPYCLTCSVTGVDGGDDYFYGIGSPKHQQQYHHYQQQQLQQQQQQQQQQHHQHPKYWNDDETNGSGSNTNGAGAAGDRPVSSSTVPSKFLKKKKQSHLFHHYSSSSSSESIMDLTGAADSASPTSTNADELHERHRDCSYHAALFSPGNGRYFVLECRGPHFPFITLHKTGRTLVEKPSMFLMHLENNTTPAKTLATFAWPQTKTFAVELSGGHQAHVRLLLPPGLREDEITTYPLVVQLTDAIRPGRQLVTDRWSLDYSHYLASNRNYIVAQIDGRGSGGQGDRFLQSVRYSLGHLDVIDQLEVLDYLSESLHFVDRNRIAVYGRNYGGFLALSALAAAASSSVPIAGTTGSTTSTPLIQCAIAVSPIVDWRLFDSFTTERLFGSPNISDSSDDRATDAATGSKSDGGRGGDGSGNNDDLNANDNRHSNRNTYRNYDEANLLRKGPMFRNKMLFLIHGTKDPLVHLQHSVLLSKALVQSGVLFRKLWYTDEDNSLANVQEHFYRSMDEFFDDCFRKQLMNVAVAGAGSTATGTSGESRS